MRIIRQMIKYMKVDLERALLSTKFVTGFIGVIIVLLWSSLNCVGGVIDNTIIFLLWWCTFNIRYLFVMFFCAIPYAGSFCEELEYGYIRQQVIRGNLVSYYVSKVLVILISGTLTMVVGIGIFVLGLSFFTPWVDINNSVYLSAVSSGSFRSVIQSGHYFIYSLLIAFQFGLLTAILALLSAGVSLFVSNKLLVWSIPMLAYYLISQYSWTIFSGKSIANIDAIYSGRYNIFQNDLISFLYAMLVTLFIGILLATVFFKRLKRRVSGE